MAFKLAKPREPLDEPQLYEYAVGALSRRMRTVAELKRLMRQRVEKSESAEQRIDAIILRLKEQNYIDDAAYAAYYTRLRQEGPKLGKRRVQQDLQQKGVESELISTTLDAAYEHVNEEDLARQHLERKRVKKPASEKEAARIMRLLVRGGFSLGVVYKILKQWDVPDDTLSAVESIDLDTPPGED
jgi:regulatory protein